jgi:hypothetical protein
MLASYQGPAAIDRESPHTDAMPTLSKWESGPAAAAGAAGSTNRVGHARGPELALCLLQEVVIKVE